MKRMRNLLLITLIATLVIVQSVPIQAKTTSIQMKQTKASLYVGKTTRLCLKQKTSKALIWSSSNTKIARVSKSGLVKAVKTGNVTITARIKGSNKKATCKIMVGDYASELTLTSAGTVILDKGKTSKIEAKVGPNKVLTKALTYTSNDSSIAVVDKNGTITAVSKGQTQVIAATRALDKKGNPLTKTIQVIVKEAKDENPNEGGSGFPGGNTGGETKKALIDTITNGASKTYVLNKAYTNDVTVSMSVNGQTWNYTGKVSSILNELNTTYTTRTNAAGTICATRNVGEEWWTVTDPSNGNALLFRVKAETSYNGNNEYGQIVIEQAGGEVSVTVY